MDTWFTTEPLLEKILEVGIDAIFGSVIVTTKHGIPVKIVIIRNRNKNDEKTYGELFIFCEDIQDMDLTTALQSLMALFVEQISILPADITACIKSKVTDWMNSQATLIQALFENICWES